MSVRRMARWLRRPHAIFSMFLFDPLEPIRKMRGLTAFSRNARAYRRANHQASFGIRWRNVWYRSYDRYDEAGGLTFHYFYQDLWGASRLYERGCRQHVDVGSRLDGFVAHVLPFCKVTYMDVRPLTAGIPGLVFLQGLITSLPFATASVASLSCLHVLEHVGLGRYGDPVDPDGHMRGAAELSRILRPGGTLLFSTPIGRERLYFDAHRVFDPGTVVALFPDLRLIEFSFIDDRGDWRRTESTFEAACQCTYGCGLFRFEKPLLH